jgi:hypothetical protein
MAGVVVASCIPARSPRTCRASAPSTASAAAAAALAALAAEVALAAEAAAAAAAAAGSRRRAMEAPRFGGAKSTQRSGGGITPLTPPQPLLLLATCPCREHRSGRLAMAQRRTKAPKEWVAKTISPSFE